MNQVADIQFVDELPKAKRGRGSHSKYDETIELLRANPGKWAVVLVEESRSKVSGAQRFLTTHYEGIEAASRTEGDEVVLYARAVEDE